MTWEQSLVGAQVEINRAIFEMNRPGQLKPRKAERRYIMVCIARAHSDLMRAWVKLEEEGLRPFSERELRKWQKKAA